MKSQGVVLLQGDPGIAQSLLTSLSHKFTSVRSVRSVEELRNSVARDRTEVAILDMEDASIQAIRELSRDFPHLSIVCTHRLADEEMWTAALSAGAADICPANDTLGILMAAQRTAPTRRSAAA